MMTEWGYDRKSVWADLDSLCVKVGFDSVLSSKVDGAKLVVTFTTDEWKKELSCEDLDKLRLESDAKLAKGAPPTKGVGKGKRKH